MKLIGIIGAMEVEVASLKEMMTDVTIRTKASMEFNHGYLNGKEVVVVRSGIGKVNAGICTQILVDDYGVDCVINTGIAYPCGMKLTSAISSFRPMLFSTTWMCASSDTRSARFRRWVF